MSKKHLVVFTGAGMSAESGLQTFRGNGGLWNGYDVMEVASIDGWMKDPKKVLQFYNERRKQSLDVEPNKGHYLLAELEEYFKISVITQNVDNLHERAGSSSVLHLHGELHKVRSTVDESRVYEMEGWELKWGDQCELGSQLRPHIVWFGEAVPKFEDAIQIASTADLFLVLGSSLAVYPAASIIDYVDRNIPCYVVDPNLPPLPGTHHFTAIEKVASEGMMQLKELLIKDH